MAITTLKKSSMGYHCDNTYNDKGIFSKSTNSYVENTPIVIVSYGAERILNWQKMNRSVDQNGKKIWLKDSSFSNTMKMNENSIVIINPLDENPHTIGNSDVIVKYQHGKVLVKESDSMSFGLVFRVVDLYYKYNPNTNIMLPLIGNKTKKEEDKSLIREHVYCSCNIEEHHCLFKKCT